MELFQFQAANNAVYSAYIKGLQIEPESVRHLNEVPYLPIQFFKSHQVITGEFESTIVFESSGTTGITTSRNYVKNIDLYIDTFQKTFDLFYGKPSDWCILGLLPSYLERNNSSLVMMVDRLIKSSQNSLSGFYLNDHEKLYQTLLHNEIAKQPTLLIGVTFGLLDFIEQYQLKLKFTIVMDTGGMKGRRKEMIRQEVHQQLMSGFGVKAIHSEYGMTELFSQAYSKKDGLFKCPPWMKVTIRSDDDPLTIKTLSKGNKRSLTGLINIIDLANLDSCGFIATDDIGILHPDECFEVLGRTDHSDIRGCSLLTFQG